MVTMVLLVGWAPLIIMQAVQALFMTLSRLFQHPGKVMMFGFELSMILNSILC